LDTGEGDGDDENEDLKAFNEEESKKYGEIGDADSVRPPNGGNQLGFRGETALHQLLNCSNCTAC